MTTAIDILKGARALISDRRRWTTAAGARDRKGNPCFAVSREAVCWCAVGALARAADGAGYQLYVEAVDRVAAAVGPDEIGPAYVNDCLGHGAVIALFDRAIKGA